MTLNLRKFHVFTLCILFCCVMGCAAKGPEFKQMEDLTGNKAVVYVYRSSSMFGGGVKPKITIDGTEMCKLAREGYMAKAVDPGRITVTAKTEVTNEVSVDIATGESAYVKVQIGVGIAVGRPKLTIVGKQEGESDIRSCKKVCGD